LLLRRNQSSDTYDRNTPKSLNETSIKKFVRFAVIGMAGDGCFEVSTSDSKQESVGRRAFVASAYVKHADELLRYLSRRLHNKQDARELAQEVWTRLLRIGNTSTILEPLAYIYRTAANVIAEFQMRRERERVSYDSDATAQAAENPAHVSPDELSEQITQQAQIERTLAALPPVYREILLLRISGESSYEEIGAKLGFSAKTTEQYFYRAIALVRTKWRRESQG